MTLNSHRAWFTVARMPAKSMRAAAATVLIAATLGTGTGATSQPPDPYQAYQSAVAMYAKTGDIARAVVPLQRWTADEFGAAVKATLAARIPRDLEAAAVFHLEIGVALVGVSTAVAAGHINYGSALLDRWTATQPRNGTTLDEQKQFRSMWFGVAQSSRDLRDLFGRVLNELRSRYLLTYTPKGGTREGWHDVRVTLKGARGEVTARPGYFIATQ